MVIGIIGGGASGMAAALTAAKNPENEIHIFEKQARLGRKLSATGNGRCNLTNTEPIAYYGEDGAFAHHALMKFSSRETLSWFLSLGLYTVTEEDGRVYPYSDQANSVLDVLRLSLQKENVTIHTCCEIVRVTKKDGGFLLRAVGVDYFCDRVIIACGGIAGSKLGGTISGYRLLGNLGHTVTRLRPALVQVTSSFPALPSLRGVRANCMVRILKDGNTFAAGTGEVQFTEKGLSGPVMFEVSRDVCEGRGKWEARMDFLPILSKKALLTMLKARRKLDYTTDDLLTGILHNRLGRVVTREAGIGPGPVSMLTDRELEKVVDTAKSFAMDINGTLGMDYAQVTAGGVLTRDFNPETMESRIVPGLYACGEVLDIDGDCGGYNLQWAWSSGRLAGAHAGKETT